jgi:hypothetical protein
MNRLLLLAAASLVHGCTGLSPAGRTLNETFPVSEEVRDLQRQVVDLAPDATRRARLAALQEAWMGTRPTPCLAAADAKDARAAGPCMSGVDQDRAQSLRRTKFLLMLEAPPQPAPPQLEQVSVAAPLDTGGGGRAIEIAPNGAKALVVGVRKLLIVDTLTGKTLRTVPVANFENAHLSVFAGGRVAVLTDQHVRGMRFWDTETGDQLREFPDAAGPHSIMPDGRRIAYADGDKLLIYDAVANRALSAPASHNREPLSRIAVSGDGKRIATLTHRGTLTLWSVLVSQVDASPILSRVASADTRIEHKEARQPVFSQDGESVWTASDTMLVRWSTPGLAQQETVRAGTIRGQGLRRIPGSDVLVVAGRHAERGSYLVFYDSARKSAALLEVERNYQPSISLSADGRLLFTSIVHELRRRDLPEAGAYADAEHVLAPLRPAPSAAQEAAKGPIIADLPADLRIEVIGVYEGGGQQVQSVQTSSGLRSARSVTVGVGNTGRPLALVLASYEPVIWDLNVAAGANLTHVLVSGYHESLVRGAGNAQVTRIGQVYTHTFADHKFKQLQERIRLYTGRTADGFQGSYRGIRFSVGAGAPRETAQTPQGLAPDVPRAPMGADHQHIERWTPSASSKSGYRAVPGTYGRIAPPAERSDAHDVRAFAEKLYQLSAYTSEEQALEALLDAETELLTSRWLAGKLAAGQGGALRPALDWERMVLALRRAVAPVAKSHLLKRARALKEAELDGREAFVREFERLVREPKDRGNIQFSSGGFVSGGGDQVEDIPEILAFHETTAAARWRKLWPELRAHAARLAALHYRIDADPALGGPGRPWSERAAALAERIGGRVLAPGEWRAMTAGRLGFTLSGLDRFLLPLGTEMRKGGGGGEVVSIADRGNAIVIAQRAGEGLAFRFLDARWERDISRRLSATELEQIDNALTATYAEKKDRWFAPLELEWNAYLSISRQVRASRQMQAVFQSFGERAASVMQGVWARWHGS